MSTRKHIRHAVANALRGTVVSSNRVYSGSQVSLERRQLPAIAIYAGRDENDTHYSATTRYCKNKRRLLLHIEILVVSRDPEDERDDLEDAVIKQLAALWKRREVPNVLGITLVDSTPVIDGRGERVHAGALLTFEIHYHEDLTD